MIEEVPDKLKKEDVESIKGKVELLYKNYGIDIDEMSDEELGRIIKHYLGNVSNIDEDFLKSKRHSEKFSEDDLI
jgi:hypothetical protein